MTPFWISAFLDFTPPAYATGVAFWRDATGYGVSSARGEHEEFASLVPPSGDPHLRLQRLGSGPSRLHLDLNVASPREAADLAVAVGARELSDRGYVILESPGGFPFCFVSHRAAGVAPAGEWGGHRSMADQVCLDIPDERYDAEAVFWQQVTGRERVPTPGHPEFERLQRPDDQPLHLLLQRLDEPRGGVRAHLDLACSDRPAETRRHEDLGATAVARHPDWTVMTDPVGSTYCLTDREPR